MAASSAGTLIGFCFAAIAVLVSFASEVSNRTALYFTYLFLVLAIVSFAEAVEYYIDAAWKAKTKEQYILWAQYGSMAYGLGKSWVVVSTGLMFLALTSFPLLPYLPQILFLGSWVIRFTKTAGGEPIPTRRWIVRLLMAVQVIIGIIVVYVLGGR
jgi:hypothetical protein